MSISKIILGKRLALSVLIATLSVFPARANEIGSVRALLDAGRIGEAQAKVDALLNQNPLDAQLQFLKGMILASQERTSEAIAVFERLNSQHPDLPEPYNNLAVLYASIGQFDKARLALEAAVRQRPTYAIAHENLGDIYSKLAAQSYDKAAQLDPGSAKVKLKRSMMLAFASSGDSSETKQALAKPAPSISVASASASHNPPPAPTTASTSAPVPVASREGEHDALLAVVNSWAGAWSAKDVAAYLNLYSPEFQTPEGEARERWEEKRRSRIEGKGKIDVKIESPKVKVRGTWAKVKFRQIYTSDRLSSRELKALVLEKRGDKWLIKREYRSI